MYSDHDVVKAKVQLSERVKKGTVGTIVMVYDPIHYEVEFINELGETVDLLTVTNEKIEPYKRSG